MKQLIKKNLIFLPRKVRVYFGRVFLYMLGRLGYDEFPLDIPLQMELKKWVELNKAKYKCKENDAIIELSKSKDEILICIDGEKSKTVIGLKDLHNALKEFGLNENDISCNTCKDKGFIKLSDGMNNCPDCYSEPVTK